MGKVSTKTEVKGLRWVGEVFFPWGSKPCHQICLYYDVSLTDDSQIPLHDCFNAYDDLDNTKVNLIFSWIPLSEIKNITIYPTNALELLQDYSGNVTHFVYKEQY